jgi:hypothetical protein
VALALPHYSVADVDMLVPGPVHLVPVATGRFGRWATLWDGDRLIVGWGAIVAILYTHIGIDWPPISTTIPQCWATH